MSGDRLLGRELAQAFRKGVAAGATEELRDDVLGPVLIRLFERGRIAWPDIALLPDRFARHLAERVAAGKPLAQALDEFAIEDSYLACACADRVAGAANAFDSRFLSQLPAFLASLKQAPAFIDDVRQILAEKLLVAPPGMTPKIAEYAGRGALASWLRVAAMRAAVTLLRKRRHLSLDGGREDGGSAPGEARRDGELDYLKRRYRNDFQEAFESALAGLPDEQRELLRLNFVEGLNIEAIGQRKNVHRATVARWIAAAREAVLDRTRRRLQERLKVSDSEFESLAGLLQSQLEVSVMGILRGERR